MQQIKKKPTALTIVVAVLLVIGIVLDVAVYGFLQNVMTMMFGDAASVTEMTEEEKAQVVADAKDVALRTAEEGMVLLDNNGTLPLDASSKKVDLLGYHAKNPYYGGTGSGALSDKSGPTDIATAFKNAGWTVNEDLLAAYGSSLPLNFELLDPDPAEYWSETDASADLAVVVFGRSGGEGSDLPTSGFGADGSGHYLQLSANEQSLLERAAAQYTNVVVVLNVSNMLEVGPVKALYSDEAGTAGNVDAVIWAGKPGYHGFPALVETIEGTVNPSGHLVDTYAYDAFSAPAARSYGDNAYTNVSVAGADNNEPAHYMEYNEGIYVGYRYYETAAELGYIDYEDAVIYPFGRGLSYTQFSWEVTAQDIPSPLKGDSKISITVTVTNEGEVAGKDVVQLYSALSAEQLQAGRLDRSAASLVAFAKTPLIEAHGSAEVTLTFDAEDLASYDDRGIYAESGAYVIEAGSYELALRTDAHTDKDAALNPVIAVEQPIVYSESSLVSGADTSVSKRPSDLVTVSNVFGTEAESILNGSAYDIDVPYLRLTSPEADWVNGYARKGDKEAPQSLVEFISNGANVSITNKGYAVHSESVTVESGGDLDVNDFAEVPYGDPSWDTLVQQMSVAEMRRLIRDGGYKSDAIASVNKAKTVDVDGPQGINYFPDPNKYAGVAYASPISLASTWNVELAEEFGASIAREGMMLGVCGWYAPGANIHRTPFSGRNFEYYSEDPVLSGFMAMYTCSAATEGGMIVYLKHFVLNDTEVNRNYNVLHWSTEQALREIYLKAFEYPVKAGARFGMTSTTGMMSGFNYIGDRWCGASYELLTTILRGEWGFCGTVVTDYFGGYGYMNADCGIRAGNDLMLSTVVAELTASSNDDKYYMQQACKNILYSYSRSGMAQSGVEAGGMETWQVIGIVANVVWWTATAALAVICGLKWLGYLRKKENVAPTQSEDPSNGGSDQ